MLSYLEKLGVGNNIAITIIFIVVLSTVISSFKVIWSTLWNKITSIFNAYKKRVDYDNKIDKHENDINTLINDTKLTYDLTMSNKNDIEKIVESQKSFINTQSELRDNVESLHSTVNAISDVVVDSQIDQWKNAINDFASAIANGRKYTRTQYHNVMNMYSKYDEILKLRNQVDDETKYSYAIIVEAYKENYNKHSFIDDMILDKNIDKKIDSLDDFDYKNYDTKARPRNNTRRSSNRKDGKK
jgi:ABC-type transporter Mla subunit MlaD